MTARAGTGSRVVKPRTLAVVGTLLLACFYAVQAVTFLPMPLRFDEVEWPPQAAAILRRGVPVIPFSEEPVVEIGDYYGRQERVGLWHPPFYLYVLAAVYRVFGISNLTSRVVGVVCLLVAVALGVALIRRLYTDRHKGCLLRWSW